MYVKLTVAIALAKASPSRRSSPGYSQRHDESRRQGIMTPEHGLFPFQIYKWQSLSGDDESWTKLKVWSDLIRNISLADNFYGVLLAR
jgi:hypothetical protein